MTVARVDFVELESASIGLVGAVLCVVGRDGMGVILVVANAFMPKSMQM